MLPPGFQDLVVLSGLEYPTAFDFAADGRVFVAEKSGKIKVLSSLTSTESTLVADLRTNVHTWVDRGVLGLALHPDFPNEPYLYVLYTHDAAIGGTAPLWGDAFGLFEGCPDPVNGCRVSGRLSRLKIAGNVMTGPEQVLIEDWCQVYDTHSVGMLAFGPDGALYASAGEGAGYTLVDFGQIGMPPNPCGDPPNEGGMLRAQDLRTRTDPLGLDGSLIRVNPATGEGLPGNPLFASTDPNERRIIAAGFRNPFRFTFRPGTSEIWTGDVGWGTWEEINRVQWADTSAVSNFGWPCYEGPGRNEALDVLDLPICEGLYADPAGAHPPFFHYKHEHEVVAGDRCPLYGASVTGLTFYSGGNYPAEYQGALFFADYSRQCLFVMRAGSNGLPDPATTSRFVLNAASPVQLRTGPGGDLFYLDIVGGALHRIRYFAGNQPPIADVVASPPNGLAPLTVTFSGAASTDANGDALVYRWDLDDDGEFDDASGVTVTRQFSSMGYYRVSLQVADPTGATSTASVLVVAGSTPPSVTITAPTPNTTWRVGESISFSAVVTDAEESISDEMIAWDLYLYHCPTDQARCHRHAINRFDHQRSGSFVAGDHEYPSYLVLQATAYDSQGLFTTSAVALQPLSTTLTVRSEPAGFPVTINSLSGTTPFSRTLIVGAATMATASEIATRDGITYSFRGWSDGGTAAHTFVAVPSPMTMTATYQPQGAGLQTSVFVPQVWR